MIVLPRGAFTVLPEKKAETTQSGIFLAKETREEPNRGIITLTCETLKHLQGKAIVFRPEFAEDIDIEGVTMKFFRDLNSSFYYIIDEDKE